MNQVKEIVSGLQSTGVSRTTASTSCSLEMESGRVVSDVSEEQLRKTLNQLRPDNSFMVLSRGDDFMQVAYSENGFVVQHKKNGKQFQAKDILQKSEAEKLCVAFLNRSSLEEMAEWENF